MKAANDNDPMLVTMTRRELKELLLEAVREAGVGHAAPPSPHEFLTEPQLCERLGISRSTLRRLRLAGLPRHQVGPRMYRYLWTEAQDWIVSRKTSSDGTTPSPLGAPPEFEGRRLSPRRYMRGVP